MLEHAARTRRWGERISSSAIGHASPVAPSLTQNGSRRRPSHGIGVQCAPPPRAPPAFCVEDAVPEFHRHHLPAVRQVASRTRRGNRNPLNAEPAHLKCCPWQRRRHQGRAPSKRSPPLYLRSRRKTVHAPTPRARFYGDPEVVHGSPPSPGCPTSPAALGRRRRPELPAGDGPPQAPKWQAPSESRPARRES